VHHNPRPLSRASLITLCAVKATADLRALFSRLLLSEIQRTSKATDRLKEDNTAETIVERWRENLLHDFLAQVTFNVERMLLLTKSHRTARDTATPNIAALNLPTLAYVVRNLLELNVWIRYCCASRDNARRFHEDFLRDMLGLQKAAKRLVNLVPYGANPTELKAEHLAELDRIEIMLQHGALTVGMSSLDEAYKKVVHAADELGWKEGFVGLNAILSKFAHPTAMAVLTSFIEADMSNNLFDLFLAIGVVLALVGLKTVAGYVTSLGVAP